MDRLLELLADEACLGLDPQQEEELERLLALHPDVDRGSFQLAAAAVDLAFAASDPAALGSTVPASLEQRLEEAVQRWQAEAPTPVVTSFEVPRPPAPRREARSRNAAAWWLAAAAALLAFVGWWPRLMGPAPETRVETPVPAPPAAAPERLLADRLAAAADRLSLPLSGTEDPTAVAGVRGELVWSSELQQAVLKVSGLAANDPAVEQYQMWIFDADRDDRYPVDGGVFDVPAGQDEVLIPIRPGVHVAAPQLFAVTVEKPGGVVVSDRSRTAVTAAARAREGFRESLPRGLLRTRRSREPSPTRSLCRGASAPGASSCAPLAAPALPQRA